MDANVNDEWVAGQVAAAPAAMPPTHPVDRTNANRKEKTPPKRGFRSL
jgi:hypothetical protein